MSDYILKYARDERVKYISHLDFVRLFHRAVRRADLPFVFSKGFNPHPVMTVSQPLSVGVTSDCEYMKVGFEGDFEEEEIKSRLNDNMPPGYTVLKVKKSSDIDITKINRARYIVECEYCGIVDIDGFMSRKELKIMKKSKSKIKESDIRPYIYNLEMIEQNDDILKLDMNIAVGNIYNLKPASVLEAMEQYTDNLKIMFFKVHRLNMTIDDENIV